MFVDQSYLYLLWLDPFLKRKIFTKKVVTLKNISRYLGKFLYTVGATAKPLVWHMLLVLVYAVGFGICRWFWQVPLVLAGAI